MRSKLLFIDKRQTIALDDSACLRAATDKKNKGKVDLLYVVQLSPNKKRKTRLI
jgi:hypothetical protein